MPELKQSEMFRFIEKAPRRVVSRYLTALGQGKEFKEVIDTTIAQELLSWINGRMLELENSILLGGLTQEKEQEAKIEYRVLKDFALDTLTRVRRYFRLCEEVRGMGEK